MACLIGMHDLFYAIVCDCIKACGTPLERGYYTGIVGDHSEPNGLRSSLARGECGLKIISQFTLGGDSLILRLAPPAGLIRTLYGLRAQQCRGRRIIIGIATKPRFAPTLWNL